MLDSRYRWPPGKWFAFQLLVANLLRENSKAGLYVGKNGLRVKSYPKLLPKSKGDSSGSKAKRAKAKEERTNPSRKDPKPKRKVTDLEVEGVKSKDDGTDPNDEVMKLMFQATIANVERAGPLKERTKSKGKDPQIQVQAQES